MFGVHALSLVIHAIATVVAWRVARRLLQDARGAVAAALVFAVHPVQVESVAWASALPGPLSSLFVLLAVASLLRWQDERGGSRPWSVAPWLLAAMLSKETALVASLLLVVLAFAREGQRSRARAACGVVCLSAVSWFALRAVVLGHVTVLPVSNGTVSQWSFATGAVEILTRQMGLLVVPWPLTPFRGLHHETITASALVAMACGVVIAVIAVAVLWRRLAARWRVAVAMALIPLLLPAATHESLGEYPLADRHLYLPVFGVALGLAGARGRYASVLWIAAAAAAVVSCRQCGVWRDQEALVAHGLAIAPEQATVHVMAGNLHLAALKEVGPGALSLARRDYTAALALLRERTDGIAKERRAAAFAGLAWCEVMDPQSGATVPQLVERFREAIAQHEASPGAWVGLGVAHALAGEFGLARAAFGRALELDADNPQAWFNLGRMQVDAGQLDDARYSLQQALRCDPRLTAASELLATLR